MQKAGSLLNHEVQQVLGAHREKTPLREQESYLEFKFAGYL